MNPRTEAGAFRHLLHDVASRVTGLGMTLDLLNHTGELSGESAELVNEARQAANTLRHLIADLGELGVFMSRRAEARPSVVRPADLLAELRSAGPSGMPPSIVVECADALPSLVVDRVQIGYAFALLARAAWRHNDVPPVVRATVVDGNAVALDVVVTRPSMGGDDDRWPYDKPPYSLDHLCEALAQASGGRFERVVTERERIVRFVFPVAPGAAV
jgi:hypothetical protein